MPLVRRNPSGRGGRGMIDGRKLARHVYSPSLPSEASESSETPLFFYYFRFLPPVTALTCSIIRPLNPTVTRHRSHPFRYPAPQLRHPAPQVLWSMAVSRCPAPAYTKLLTATRFWLMANVGAVNKPQHLRVLAACFR